MNAQAGTQFLILLLSSDEYPMDTTDLEEAIRIASVKSPSGAFDAAQLYYATRHGSMVARGYLGFAKGTRWLAMIRRDEGQAAFDRALQQLRQVAAQL